MEQDEPAVVQQRGPESTNECMTFMQRLKDAGNKIDEILANAERDIPIVVVLGATGSGKSTLLNSIVGTPLGVERDKFGDPIIVIGKDVQTDIVIGSSCESVTTIPNIYHDKQNGIIFCDCPGFLDSKGSESNIINAFMIDSLIKRAKETNPVSVLYVIGFDEFTSGRGVVIRDTSKEISQMFPNKRQLEQCLTGVMTKINIVRTRKEQALEACRNVEEMKIFGEDLSKIFIFPLPSLKSIESHVYSDFQEKDQLIEHLKKNCVMDIDNQIVLNMDAIYYLKNLAKQSFNMGTFPSRFAAILISQYVSDDIDGLARCRAKIESYMGKIGSIDDFLQVVQNEDGNEQIAALIEEIREFSGIASFISSVAYNSEMTTYELRETMFYCGRGIQLFFDRELRNALILNNTMIQIAEKEGEISYLTSQMDSLDDTDAEKGLELSGMVDALQDETKLMKRSLREKLCKFFGSFEKILDTMLKFVDSGNQ